jgi:hypothetical protein
MYSGLRWFRLLFAVHVWDKRHVNQSKIFVADAELKLAHCFDERGRFDVTYGASQLKDIISYSITARKPLQRGELASTMHTSGSSPVSSTGILETRSIQSWIAFTK